jgi:hypothetical protein
VADVRGAGGDPRRRHEQPAVAADRQPDQAEVLELRRRLLAVAQLLGHLESWYPLRRDRLHDLGDSMKSSATRQQSVQRRKLAHPWQAGSVVAVAVIITVAYMLGSRHEHSVQAWCRSQVHVGDYLSELRMPTPVLVSHGVWTFDGGVTVSFVDGQVYDKNCG